MDKKLLYILKISTIVMSLLISFFFVRYLGLVGLDKSLYQDSISMIIFLFNILIFMIWVSFGVTASIIFLSIAVTLTLLTAAISKDFLFNLHLITFILLTLSLYYYDKWVNASKGAYLSILEDAEKNINSLDNEYKQCKLQTKALQKRFSKFSILKDITESLSSSLSLAEVANLIVKNSFNIIGKADISLLFLINEKKHKLILTSIRKSPEYKDLKVEGIDSFDKRILRRREPLIIQDIRKDYRFGHEMVKNRRREFRSLISTPLISKERAIGTARLDSFKPETFNSEDLRILNIIANLAAVAVENAKLFERTEELAITDGLTNCYVQRYMRELAQEEIKNIAKTKEKLSFLMIDIDYFKKYNDKYGHSAGDIILKETSKIFREISGPKAIVSRYGGEEFAIVLPKTDEKEAQDIAERIRKKIEKEKFYLRREKTEVTISIGVATLRDANEDLNGLINKADKALYKAKEAGRNKVCVA